MFCPECGKETGEGKFCQNCGKDLSSLTAIDDVNSADKNREDTVTVESSSSSGDSNPYLTSSKQKNFIINFFVGYKDFKNLSVSKKIIHIIVPLLIIIFIISFVFGSGSDSGNGSSANSLVISNESAEYFGGVSFNVTLDQFVENYNSAVYQHSYEEHSDEAKSVIETYAKLYYISSDDLVYSADLSNDYFKGYRLSYHTAVGTAAAFISTDSETGLIQCVELKVTDDLYKSSQEITRKYWNELVPYYLFSGIDPDYEEVFYSMGEDIYTYTKGALYLSGCTERTNDVLQDIFICACTQDSQWYTKNNF